MKKESSTFDFQGKKNAVVALSFDMAASVPGNATLQRGSNNERATLERGVPR